MAGVDLLRRPFRIQGSEDKENEYLNVRASLGDGSAAARLGNRFYWGTNGLEQDHLAAFQHFDTSRRAGVVAGTLGAGKMLLKVKNYSPFTQVLGQL